MVFMLLDDWIYEVALWQFQQKISQSEGEFKYKPLLLWVSHPNILPPSPLELFKINVLHLPQCL